MVKTHCENYLWLYIRDHTFNKPASIEWVKYQLMYSFEKTEGMQSSYAQSAKYSTWTTISMRQDRISLKLYYVT